MIGFPNCKINLGLRILRRREDGYHDLETIFYPLPFHDALELIPSAELSFSATGLSVVEKNSDNLCMKAYELLKKDFPGLTPVHIYLHKAIPAGAGLGGGSADAAFMLQLLNRLFNLDIPESRLTRYAAELGSDCAFFLVNKACFATSRGEKVTPVPVDLSAYCIVLVNPRIHINTRDAFAGITPVVPQKSVSVIIRQPAETWKEELINDFEATVFQLYPAVQEIKEELYRKGAVYASMSGSGSTVFGLFEKEKSLSLAFPKNYFVKELLCKQ